MPRTFLLTLLSLLAFAANSLLCRLALKQTTIDAVSFTSLRLVSGAVALALLNWKGQSLFHNGSWWSAAALFVYALAFSLAYRTLSAGTGALLLFGAVQVTMICWGFWKGERLRRLQLLGLALAIAGLVVLLLPGLAAPPPLSAGLMLAAGIAWGSYSLRGKLAADAVAATAGNFLFAAPFAIVASFCFYPGIHLDSLGITYALISGALTSGLGYVVWYSVLPKLRATTAATVQLSVPLLAAAGGVCLLGEVITLRLLFAAMMVLGGIATFVWRREELARKGECR